MVVNIEKIEYLGCTNGNILAILDDFIVII